MKKTILASLVAAAVVASGNANAAAFALSDNLQVHVVTGQTATGVTALAATPGEIETRGQNTVNVVDATTVAASVGIIGAAGHRNQQLSLIAGQDANAITAGTLSGAGTDTVAVNVVNQQTATTVGLGLGVGVGGSLSRQGSLFAAQDAYAVTALSASGGDITTLGGNSVNSNTSNVFGAGLVAGVALNANRQGSAVALQDADANAFLVASGGDVSTSAVNQVNTADLGAGAAGFVVALAGNDSAQASVFAGQSSQAVTLGALAAGDVSTTAANSVNTANISAVAVSPVIAVAGNTNAQVSGLALQGSTAAAVGVLAGGNVSTQAVNSVNGATMSTIALDPALP